MKHLLLILSIYSAFCENIEVAIKNGKIKGRILITKYNRTFYSFQQIPFAEPPVGELRFEPPVPVKNWDGTLDCTNNTKICMQILKTSELESEDCLYLNVYTPVKPGTFKKLPVLYYIHGGGFIHGNGIFNTNGPHYFMDNDIVVVTVSYRLGVFGFISTQDSVLPGNNGLRDQRLGLRWLNENIGAFGGDPEEVTLMGQSAGASSVTYQMMNMEARSYYRAAIGQSGAMISPRAFAPNAKSVAFDLGKRLNFSKGSSQELKDFLLKKTAMEIKSASNVLYDNYTDNIFLPVVEEPHEDAFINKPMYTALVNGEVNKIPLLIGSVSQEMIWKLKDGVDAFSRHMKAYDDDLSLLVPKDMGIINRNMKEKLGKKIRKMYTNGTLQDDIQAGIRYFSDRDYVKSTMRFAELHSEFAEVHFYKFSYSGEMGHNNMVKLPGLGKVGHSEDNNYIWVTNGDDRAIEQYPKTDKFISELYVKMFADFTKKSNVRCLVNNVEWPKMKKGNFLYLNIDEKLDIKQDPMGELYQEWISLYDQYATKPLYTF